MNENERRQYEKEIAELKVENERLYDEIKTCKDLLCSKDDADYKKVSLTNLVKEATNNGDYFPASQIRRMKSDEESSKRIVISARAEKNEMMQELIKATEEKHVGFARHSDLVVEIQKERAKIRDLLVQIEWGINGQSCPGCGSTDTEFIRHTDDCLLVAMIKKLEKLA